MSACEKCWGDAYMRNLSNGLGQAENYKILLEERKDRPCTPEQQAGKDKFEDLGLIDMAKSFLKPEPESKRK